MANHQQKGVEAQARIYPGLRGGKNTDKDVRPKANLTRITNWRTWKVSSEGRRQRCFPERQSRSEWRYSATDFTPLYFHEIYSRKPQ